MTSEEKKEEMLHEHDVDIAVLKVKLVEITGKQTALKGHVDDRFVQMEQKLEQRFDDSFRKLIQRGDENQEELLQAITASKWAKEILQSKWKLTGTIVAAGATMFAALGGLIVGVMKLIGLLLPPR